MPRRGMDFRGIPDLSVGLIRLGVEELRGLLVGFFVVTFPW